MGLLENTSRLHWAKNVELSKDRHHKAILVAIVRRPDILLDIRAFQSRFLSLLPGVSYRSRREIDPYTTMPEFGQSIRVQSGTTAEVENPRRISLQNPIVNPPDVFIDNLKATTGSVVLLRQMLIEHASAKVWVIPRDLFPLSPRFWVSLPVNDI
jgi:hypothetical protein